MEGDNELCSCLCSVSWTVRRSATGPFWRHLRSNLQPWRCFHSFWSEAFTALLMKVAVYIQGYSAALLPIRTTSTPYFRSVRVISLCTNLCYSLVIIWCTTEFRIKWWRNICLLHCGSISFCSIVRGVLFHGLKRSEREAMSLLSSIVLKKALIYLSNAWYVFVFWLFIKGRIRFRFRYLKRI
jgi:hypothetical protein